ncbi:MAG: hypothetical protein ACREJT_03700, partial [Myxococcota bacterium]
MAMKELRWSEVNGVLATATEFPVIRLAYLPISCVSVAVATGRGWLEGTPEVLNACRPWTLSRCLTET